MTTPIIDVFFTVGTCFLLWKYFYLKRLNFITMKYTINSILRNGNRTLADESGYPLEFKITLDNGSTREGIRTFVNLEDFNEGDVIELEDSELADLINENSILKEQDRLAREKFIEAGAESRVAILSAKFDKLKNKLKKANGAPQGATGGANQATDAELDAIEAKIAAGTALTRAEKRMADANNIVYA